MKVSKAPALVQFNLNLRIMRTQACYERTGELSEVWEGTGRAAELTCLDLN